MLVYVHEGVKDLQRQPTCRGWLSPSTMWVLRSESAHQFWQQIPLPSEPSHLSFIFVLDTYIICDE